MADPKNRKLLSKAVGYDEKQANSPERQMMIAAINAGMQQIQQGAKKAMANLPPPVPQAQPAAPSGEPSVSPTLGDGMGGQAMPTLPQSAPPNVTKAPPTWGQMTAKQRFGRIAEIIGTIAMPQQMALIPGTPQHTAAVQQHTAAVQQRAIAVGTQIAKLQDAQAQAELRKAQAAGAETAEQKVGVKEDEIQERLEAEQLKTASDAAKLQSEEAYRAYQSNPKNPKVIATLMNARAHEMEAEASEKKASTPGGGGRVSGFGAYALYRMVAEAYTHNPELLKAVPAFAKSMGVELPPDIQDVLKGIPIDQPLSPTTGKPIGTGMPGAPTQNTRSTAQMAQRYLDEYPRISADVNAAADNLGPISGRKAIGFMLGAIGSTGGAKADQQLAKLRADLALTGSNVARFHINSVRQAELFDRLIAAGKSPAPAIQGTLDAFRDWATTAAKQERGFGEQDSGKPPKGATGRAMGPDGKLHWADESGKDYGVAQ